MASNTEQVTHDFPPYFKVYKDGTIERYLNTVYVPPGLDTATGVQSKDVVVSPETGVKARIFIPKIDGPPQKLPLLVHYHGGAFSIASAFDTNGTNYLTSLVSHGNIIAVSIDYRLAPEHPLPIGYDDSWAALQWVATHSNGSGPEPWLNKYADPGQVFLEGESAGANIAHHVAVRAGGTGLAGLKITGVLAVHPFFGVKQHGALYKYVCPSSDLDDDPNLNPEVDPNLKKMACKRVLVCVAENDELRDRGGAYYGTLAKSEWGGRVELYETLDGDHCFHMFSDPNTEKVKHLVKKMVDFIYQ